MAGKSSMAMLAALDQQINPPSTAETAACPPKGRSAGRAGLKHIGGYLPPEVVEKVAILRVRLGLDNSELLTKAIELLHDQERARRSFAD